MDAPAAGTPLAGPVRRALSRRTCSKDGPDAAIGARDRVIAILLARVKKYQRLIAKQEAKMADWADDLGAAEKMVRDLLGRLPAFPYALPSGRSVRGGPPLPRRPAEDEARKAIAREGVETVELRWLSAGGADVFLNGVRAVGALTPRLALLLDLLQADTDASDGDKVGWKSPQALTEAWTVRTGRSCTYAGLTTSISRLREAFRRAGANEYLIQTRRGQGYRFARKTRPSGG